MNGKVLKKQRVSKPQRKLVNALVTVARQMDDQLPWEGLSLIAVAQKP